MEGSWSRLPEEIGERVLSFLPVPALFRCRSVCKRWNELVRKPSFLDLCDLNGRNKAHLFVTHHFTLDGYCWVDGAYRRMTCFLDLDERRWYSIPADASLLAPTNGNLPRLLAMDGGLVCELSVLPHSPHEHMLVMFDPVAQTRRELPASTYDGPICREEGNSPPVIVTVVENNDRRSFKVFLVNTYSIFMNKQSGFFVYESSTNAWRGLRNPPLELGVRAGETPGRRIEESAVFFRGNLYATFWYYNSGSKVRLLSYNLEENLWREVYAVNAKNPGYPQLIVSGNRMFLAMWVDAPHPTHLDYPNVAIRLNYSVLEITEILVDENSSRSLVKIPKEDLEQICGESQFDISFGFPLNSNSLMLFSRSTGNVIIYDLRSGSVATLPSHPLHPSEQALLELEEEEISSHFCAKLTNLSLRNILSGGPVTSRSHA